jgi:hypothetical protein
LRMGVQRADTEVRAPVTLVLDPVGEWISVGSPVEGQTRLVCHHGRGSFALTPPSPTVTRIVLIERWFVGEGACARLRRPTWSTVLPPFSHAEGDSGGWCIRAPARDDGESKGGNHAVPYRGRPHERFCADAYAAGGHGGPGSRDARLGVRRRPPFRVPPPGTCLGREGRSTADGRLCRWLVDVVRVRGPGSEVGGRSPGIQNGGRTVL